jgi:serine/threonine-protein kinase
VGGEGGPLQVALSVVRSADPALVGTRVPVRTFPFTVGRSNDANLIVDDRRVSRKHFEIHHERASYWLRDLGSTNGTYLNGRQLGAEPEALLFHDVISVPEAIAVTFVAEAPRFPDFTHRIIASRFRLDQRLHAGTRAVTYACTDLKFRRRLAIKILSPLLVGLPHYEAEFVRQAEESARLTHPYICKVIEVGEDVVEVAGAQRKLRYLCTELLEGGSLTEQLETRAAHPLSVVAELLGKIANALSYAHGEGIAHGGVNPGCILFDARGEPRLTDFAFARRLDDPHRRPLVGVPGFLAPEQWDGLPATESSDQFALACVGYALTTGFRPFEGQENPEVRRRNFRSGPPLAHEEALRGGREIPEALSSVLAKALSLQTTERYGSVLEFASAFREAALARQVVKSEPEVFISYRRDVSAGWAVLISRELRLKHGIRVFVDTERRDSAMPLPEKLKRAIVQCDVFVCLLADETLSSTWVREEIDLAVRHSKPLVPVFQESFRAPGDIDASVHAILNHDGVQLLDRRNIHIDHSIADLAQLVLNTVGAAKEDH